MCIIDAAVGLCNQSPLLHCRTALAPAMAPSLAVASSSVVAAGFMVAGAVRTDATLVECGK